MLIPMVAADLNKWVSFGSCRVRTIHGFNNQATDLYIQLHEASKLGASATISNGAIPKCKSLHTQSMNSFKWEFVDGLDFADCHRSQAPTQMISREARLPPEFKHITKGRTRQ